MRLLAGLHAIAARRGDGLRPELIRLLRSPEPRSEVDQTWPDTASSDDNTLIRSEAPRDPPTAIVPAHNNEAQTPSNNDLIRVLWPISKW
jgi:hypothetical protein